VFSAGFDLGVLLSGGDAGPGLLRAGMETALRMLSFPTPVVVACSGHAVAMGMFLLLAGDYRLGVTGEFRIGANEVSIGMTMTATAVEVSRQRLSPPYLGRVLDNAEMFGPDDAVAAGILDRVVAAEALRAAALDAARQLASLDMGAHALTKRLVRAPALVSMSAAIEADDAAFRAVLRAGVGPPAGQGVPGLDRSERAFE